jgi:hypothetical protein
MAAMLARRAGEEWVWVDGDGAVPVRCNARPAGAWDLNSQARASEKMGRAQWSGTGDKAALA